LIIGRNLVKILDIESGKVSHILGIKSVAVHSVAITYDAKKIAFGRCCFSPFIEIFNLSTKKELDLENTVRERSCIYALAITPDDKTLISGGPNYSIKFWNLETGQLLHSIDNVGSSIYALTVTPDGTKIISGHGNGTIKVWGIPELSDV
jgi:WD40 repeat protein